jgi:tetratricopeptide (TPR) repeat protein
MKKLLFLFCFFYFTYPAFPQNHSIELLLQKIAVEKNEDKKVNLIVSIWENPSSFDPYPLIQTGQALLKQSMQDEDFVKESSAYCFLGTGFRISGNPIRALEVQQKGLKLAEKAGNFSILAMVKNQMGHTYRDRDEWENAFKIYSDALKDALKGKNEVVKIY